MRDDVYEQEAAALWDALRAGSEDALWRVKWEHPRFEGQSLQDVRNATLQLADARTVIAREHALESWAALVDFTRAVASDPAVIEFEAAADAIIDGDVATLQTMLARNGGLAQARSTRAHRATLLHYIAANGVEGARQRVPHNAVDVARTLLDASAEADALADMYGAECTTMSMLVSSSHPAEAGVQAPLAELLLDYGAAIDGAGTKWVSPLLTALTFGYLQTAEVLAACGASISFETAAGLGRVDDVARLLSAADARSRHVALALAAQHGHSAIVELLVRSGEDPNRFNPDGFHAHTTPLHQAVWAGQMAVVRTLVDLGARLDVRDTIYSGTPLEWAVHGGRTAIEEFLRERGG
jgi:ankyrin repeat protein